MKNTDKKTPKGKPENKKKDMAKKMKYHVGGSFAKHIDEMKAKGLRYM